MLENKPSPDLDILRSVAGLDPAAVKSIDMLCSSKVEDRRAISLDRIAKEFTALAQNMEEIPLPKLANGYRFGKYEIISFLSSTYMSVVYHARDVSLGQDVAIKFLRASSNAAVSAVRAAFNSWNSIDPRYTARWLGEGVAFALNGNIEDGSSEDLNAVRVHYLVMEFIEGQNIAQFLGEGVSKPDVALKIGSKIIQAVSAIHAAQWTHRDIKPDNIIISANHAIHVVDFGLSQRIDEPIGTQQGYSPGYT
ncbi:protein kinase, partial [bacterium]|nr:protein kinase [bacterium]